MRIERAEGGKRGDMETDVHDTGECSGDTVKGGGERGVDEPTQDTENEGGSGGAAGEVVEDENEETEKKQKEEESDSGGGFAVLEVEGIDIDTLKEKKGSEVEGNDDEDEKERIGKRAVRTLALRILPLQCAASCTFQICRGHIWLAALSIMDALQLNRASFGFAVSTYSIAYAVCLVPMTMLAKQMGARTSFASILAGFGIINMATAAVTSMGGLIGARVVQAVIQCAWIPSVAAYNAAFFKGDASWAMSVGMQLGMTLARIIPVGSIILYATSSSEMPQDWQWLLIVEGTFPLLLAPLVLLLIPVSPLRTGTILDAEERSWLEEREAKSSSGASPPSKTTATDDFSDGSTTAKKNVKRDKSDDIVALLMDPRMGVLIVVTLLHFVGFASVDYWAPTTLSEEGGLSLGTSALVTSVPSAAAIPISIAFSAHADRSGDELGHAAVGEFILFLGVMIAAFALQFFNGVVVPLTVLLVLALIVHQAGMNCFYNTYIGYQSRKVFSSYSKSAVSFGFALVNVGSALGNYLGPWLVGVMAKRIDFPFAFFTISIFPGISVLLLILLKRIERRRALAHATRELASIDIADNQ